MQRLKAIRHIKLTIKKILNVLLETCELDCDDYSLNIIPVPAIDDETWVDYDLDNEDNSSKEPSLFD